MIIRDLTIPGDFRYTDRQGRAEFVVRCFSFALQEPLLDVGCGEKYLRRFLPASFEYIGLDLSRPADIRCDLDRGHIPFKSRSFATVVCTDVLEHLEHIHEVFSQLLEAASRYVVLSMPNCWNDFKYLMVQNKGSGKFYGLPPARPADRHRWFFNYSEARRFLIENCSAKAKALNLYRYYGKKGAVFRLGRLLLASPRFDNLFVNALWAVIEK